MFKIIFLALFAVATAGVIHDHFGAGPGPLVFGPAPVHASPVLHAAPAAATSFANSNLVALHPHAVAVASAPVVQAAPALAAGPLVVGHGYGGHGYYGHP